MQGELGIGFLVGALLLILYVLYKWALKFARIQ